MGGHEDTPEVGSHVDHVPLRRRERELFIDNLLVRIHNTIVMIGWTGLAPWEFEFPFAGSLTSTFLPSCAEHAAGAALARCDVYIHIYIYMYMYLYIYVYR